MKHWVARSSLFFCMCAGAGFTDCTAHLPARSPECTAIINRCMDACGNQPAGLENSQNTDPGEGRSGTTAAARCEQACANRC